MTSQSGRPNVGDFRNSGAISLCLPAIFPSHRTATFIVASMITVAATSATMADEAADSIYVQRMMSLDKNDNGLLESSELPPPLRKQLQQIDTNKDQVISVQELIAHEQQTLRARAGMSPTNSKPSAADRREVQVPTDFHQILKFALSFDRDGDGGLNATELKRYASALAVQHRAARTQQTDVGDAAYDYEGPISRPGKMQTQPIPAVPAAAAKAKGLGADGRGDGGFGDEP